METQALTLKVLLSHCLGNARGDVVEGAILRVPGDLTIGEAERKLALGYVEVVSDEEETPSGAEPATNPRGPSAPGEFEDRDPEPEDRDPKPASKLKPKPRRKKPRSDR